MAEKGDEDKLKDDFYDSFLPDGITIYKTDDPETDTDESVDRDTAAEDEASAAVKDITDAMADAVIDYVDDTLESNSYKSRSDIYDMIDERVAEFGEDLAVGDAKGIGGTGTDTLNERIERLNNQAYWTLEALKFFAFNSTTFSTGGDEPWDDVDSGTSGSGFFEAWQHRTEEARMFTPEELESMYRAFRDHMNNWPDVDI